MSPTTSESSPSGLTVLAVDDELPALGELEYLLRAQPEVGTVHTARDATTALRLLRAHAVDAVFLDINMPGLDGLELAGILAEFASRPAVVFVTAHDDRAVAAFDLGAVDYLLKPLREERLAESLRRILAGRAPAPEAAPTQARSAGPRDADEVIPVELGGVTTLVPRSSVGWVEADGDYARLHTSNGSHLVRIPLSTLEERWADAGFLRVHRSLPRVDGTGHRDQVDGNGGRRHAARQRRIPRRRTPRQPPPRPRAQGPSRPRPAPVAGDAVTAPRPERERVVLAKRRGARVVRTRVEVAEQTEVGEALIRGLMRAQLALAVRVAVVAVLLLGSIPLIAFAFPAFADAVVLGVRLPWLMLGVAAYPVLFGLGRVYVRQAERNEADFVDLVED